MHKNILSNELAKHQYSKLQVIEIQCRLANSKQFNPFTTVAIMVSAQQYVQSNEIK